METNTRGAINAPGSHPYALGAVVERASREHGWRMIEQGSEGRIDLRIAGEWTDYDLTLREVPEQNSVEVRCAFALAPPPERRGEVARLADSMNRSFHRGVLELEIERDRGSYIDWATVRDSSDPAGLIRTIRGAIGTCDMLLFPAFHCVSWAEVTADSALDRLDFGPVRQRLH